MLALSRKNILFLIELIYEETSICYADGGLALGFPAKLGQPTCFGPIFHLAYFSFKDRQPIRSKRAF
jgi:hypothetical protein